MKRYITTLVLSLIISFFVFGISNPVHSAGFGSTPLTCSSTSNNFPNCLIFNSLEDWPLFSYPPYVSTTTTIYTNAGISICVANPTERWDYISSIAGSYIVPLEHIAVFDKYGTRLDFTNENQVTDPSYRCLIPKQYILLDKNGDGDPYQNASTTEFYFYYDQTNYSYTHPSATLSQCQSGGILSFVRSYKWDILYRNLNTFDSISGGGIASGEFEPTLNMPQYASVFMSGFLTYIVGAGFGVLQALMPYIVGLAVISAIIYFLYRAFRFFKNKK